MKKLSRITELFTESVIREMTRICDAAGGDNLSQGFPDFAAPEKLKDAAVKAILSDLNQYPVTFGEPELREAIAHKARSFNKIDCNAETDITVTCGATEGMIATLKAIINPGDEIIIFEPFYENYGPDGILSGAKPRYVRLRRPDWAFDLTELSKTFNNKTKAIIINTPNNPTGKVFSKEELGQIANLCRKWDSYAITDEIYEHITYDGNHHTSLASLDGMAERTITVNSISKTYSVTGWRVGWTIASPEITARIRKVHDFLTVGAPTPLQHAAVTALKFPDSYYEGLCDHYLKARNFLCKTLENANFSLQRPQGAYYILTEINNLMEQLKAVDDFDFAQKLINTAKVATVPGSSFYSNPAMGKNEVRFTFCKQQETMERVASRMADIF
jgi:aminotransferase